MQKNLNSEIYNFDYNLNKELIGSKYGLFLNKNDQSSEDLSSEEEKFKNSKINISLRNKENENLYNNQINEKNNTLLK